MSRTNKQSKQNENKTKISVACCKPTATMHKRYS